MATSSATQDSHKVALATSLLQPYPSPSQSPASLSRATMSPETNGPAASIVARRRSSVKSLLNSANPPASALDALVMALEATVEDEAAGVLGRDLKAQPAKVDEDDDPDATVPSSPTAFMRGVTGSTTHHLPTLHLPEAASPQGPSVHSLTPSTDSSQGYPSDGSSLDHQELMSSAELETRSQSASPRSHHGRASSGKKPYVCRFESCTRAFTQLGNLKTHERKHTGERPYKCPFPDCDKTFTQLGNLKTHERIHDVVKPFICRLPGCGKTFSQLGNLKTHTAKMHPDAPMTDEELSIRTRGGDGHSRGQSGFGRSQRTAVLVNPEGGDGPVQVITYFTPQQRRPIKPQQSEEARLVRKIREMMRFQRRRRVRELEAGSEASDDMDE
ncbi:hypothetical protein BGW38_009389 [Lunasporangiospora selenospora]|uniref:C2H2-type domain-containing protein n=1 Tax=Lunasporangiospora selenospora TaxID=979761 RepID=A0A9P6FXW1_9FUNG|nr:hypothetical protein BGW38_009389 [Lunasporangiospora selenospora]